MTVDPLGGTEVLEVSVAMNVTDWLTCDGLGDDVRVVAVSAVKLFTSTPAVPLVGHVPNFSLTEQPFATTRSGLPSRFKSPIATRLELR